MALLHPTEDIVFKLFFTLRGAVAPARASRRAAWRNDLPGPYFAGAGGVARGGSGHMQGGARWVVTVSSAMALAYTLAPSASAQSPADKEQAKVLVGEGRKLRDESKDHKGALGKFAAAYKLVKTPIIGLDLANEHVAVGQLVEAYDVCDEIGRIPSKDTESPESKEARAKAASLGAEVKGRIPKLVIKLTGDGAKATVLLDGAPLAPESLLVARPVNPGKHTLVARVPGATENAVTVTVVEQESKEVVLEVPSVATSTVVGTPSPAVSSPEVPLPAVPSKDTSSSSALAWTGLAVGGVGLVTLGVGGFLGLAAKSKASGANCDANNVCATPADVDQRQAAVKQANVATILVGVGAVLAVGGVVLWIAAPSGKSEQKAASGVSGVGLGPTGLLVRGQF